MLNAQTLFDLPPAIPAHPAKYSRELLSVFVQMLKGSTRLLDPFAGVGGIFRLAPFLPGCEIHGVEIEPEWAAAHPSITVGNALALPWPAGSFDAICTSPCYGNRMADHHEAKDKSKRHTYRHCLGRPLHRDNAGALQWGGEYRVFHVKAWAEAVRVLQPGGRFVLNVKDFYKGPHLHPVTDWHIATLTGLGLRLVEHRQIPVKSFRHGANREKRAMYESVILFGG
jgi:tRNA G10  N-methylase Trm11